MKTSISDSPRQEKRGKTALLVIDVQLGLFQQSNTIYRAEELLQNINALIEGIIPA